MRLACKPPGRGFRRSGSDRGVNFEGDEDDAAISRDGKFVAFRADREGPFDVWLSQVGTGTTRANSLGSPS